MPPDLTPSRSSPQPHTSLREVLCPKNLPLLSIALREPKETVLDMAKAMLDLGAVKPKRRGKDEL